MLRQNRKINTLNGHSVKSVFNDARVNFSRFGKFFRFVNHFNGSLLEFYRVSPGINSRVNQLLGNFNAAIMVNAYFSNSKTRMTFAYPFITYFYRSHPFPPLFLFEFYYQELFPPSIVRLAPVINDEASEHKNIIAATYSFSLAIRPSIFAAPNRLTKSDGILSVPTPPGEKALTLMLYCPKYAAICRVRPTKPVLLAV